MAMGQDTRIRAGKRKLRKWIDTTLVLCMAGNGIPNWRNGIGRLSLVLLRCLDSAEDDMDVELGGISIAEIQKHLEKPRLLLLACIKASESDMIFYLLS